MYVSMLDAGTMEVLREMGKTVVSSADLVSRFEAVLTEAQIASHYEAQKALDEILAEGFREIGRRVRPANGAPGAGDRIRHGACGFRKPCGARTWCGRTGRMSQ